MGAAAQSIISYNYIIRLYQMPRKEASRTLRLDMRIMNEAGMPTHDYSHSPLLLLPLASTPTRLWTFCKMQPASAASSNSATTAAAAQAGPGAP